MQNQHIKLHEIIWEVTGKCNNRCEYCGSKDAWNATIDNNTIIKIAENIALFPPEEIDISGGDPLLVDLATHEIITNVLKDKKVKCKILVNPKSINKRQETIKVLSLYDWIGISINTSEELKLMDGYGINNVLKKSTIISNFNLQNIFIYNEIEEFVKKHNLMWQIQYTIYKDSNDPLAIYNNDKALAFFSSQISKSIADGVKILIADNANCGNCGAGMHSIGILFNGDIVPCLSMRSWLEINSVIVGNILNEKNSQKNKDVNYGYKTDKGYNDYKENPLKYIWENRFDKYRFFSFECCKDKCKNKCVEIKSVNKSIPIEKIPKDPDLCEKIPKMPPCPPTIVYGVFPRPPRVLLYGIGGQEGTYVYACPGGWDNGTIQVYAVNMPSSTCETETNIDTKTTTGNDKKDDDEIKNKDSDGH